mgnify:CR=1 FL=1
MIVFILSCLIYLKAADKSFKKFKDFSALNHLVMKKLSFAMAFILDTFMYLFINLLLSSRPLTKNTLFADETSTTFHWKTIIVVIIIITYNNNRRH